MDKEFDYSEAMAELEAITEKIESSDTKLSELDAYVKKAKTLIESCRKYLRTVQESIEKTIGDGK